ncbi:MAG: hypothetical protein ACOX7I_03955 [Oscillospiraceae bacterium]
MDLSGRKFQVFYPGVYSPEERAALDGLMEKVRNSGGVGPMTDRTVMADEKEMLAYAQIWDRYNPLFNNPGYAARTRWGKIPALPCFIFRENITGFPMMDEIGDALGDLFYYANDGGDIELFDYVYAGDEITFKSTKQEITDVTPSEGSTLRQFKLYGEGEMYDGNGRLIGRGKGYGRNAMMRFIDGGPIPSDYEQTFEWLDYIPPVHITTEEEWEYIVSLWKNEEIRGSVPRYWQDVSVGDELTPVCSGPISDIDMFRLHGDMLMSMPDARGFIEAGMGGELMTDRYGQKIHFIARHYSYCRIPGARAVFYNFTARNFILRMVTNWMGDDGFLRAFKWRFQNLFKCMADNQPGKKMLDKVPSMRGKYVNRHGMEGDTAICKGVVTDKYIRNGLHLVDVTCWAETLGGDIIQVMDTTVELPSKS